MPNVKSEVYARIADMLVQRRNELRCKMQRARYQMKQLHAEQEKLKREYVEMDKLYVEYLGKSKIKDKP